MTLLDRCVEAHGGAARWAGLTALEAELRSGGAAYPMRMRRSPVTLQIELDPHEPGSVLHDYPVPGRRGIFAPDRVAIETADGDLVAERDNPRRCFRAFSRRAVRWDDLDLLYFAGYASWNYLTTPWLLTRRGVEVREDGAGILHATFPPDVPTHSREQRFHVGEDGLLARLDYTAEVFGGWAKAVHTCAEHRSFDGLVFPTRRRVVPRGPGGRPLPGPTLIWIELDDVRPRRSAA